MLSYALRCRLESCLDHLMKVNLEDAKLPGFYHGAHEGVRQLLEAFQNHLYYAHAGHQSGYYEGPYVEYTEFDGRGGYVTKTKYLTPDEHTQIV